MISRVPTCQVTSTSLLYAAQVIQQCLDGPAMRDTDVTTCSPVDCKTSLEDVVCPDHCKCHTTVPVCVLCQKLIALRHMSLLWACMLSEIAYEEHTLVTVSNGVPVPLSCYCQ